MKILALMILGCALYAEDAKKSETIAPIVTLEHRLDYQRARANLAAMKEQNAANEKAAQKAIEDALAAAAKDCGTAQVIGDAKGDPACPVPEKK